MGLAMAREASLCLLADIGLPFAPEHIVGLFPPGPESFLGAFCSWGVPLAFPLGTWIGLVFPGPGSSQDALFARGWHGCCEAWFGLVSPGPESFWDALLGLEVPFTID